MELKIKEKRKLDNYQAQYNSVLGNITVANKTLESLYKEIKIEKKESKVSKEERDETLQLIIDFEKFRKTTLSSIKLRVEEVEEKEGKLHKFKKDLNLWKGKIEKEIREKVNSAKSTLRDFSEQTKQKCEFLSELCVDEKDLIERIEREGEIMVKIRKETQQLDDEKKENLSILSSESEKLQKEIRLGEIKLKDLKKQILNEIAKVGKADESIRIREKQLKIKEHDIYVLTTRIRKKHKQLFPDLNLQI